MLVYVATKNAGKLRELREMFARSGWQLETFAGYVDVAEGEHSYAENAALKARALRAQLLAAGTHAAVIGDDSGLEVAALGGRPGVLSARYGGEGASWSERRHALLRELAATGDGERRGRFVCAIHFIDADGSELAVERDLPGRIATEERGEQGFSYDPIFMCEPRGHTFGELAEQEKNAVSHRALAVEALLDAYGARRSEASH
ncbi:MAG: non-canonical purine NTP pyrophosphatase [Vulcanimicrobiaceae bacterium]